METNPIPFVKPLFQYRTDCDNLRLQRSWAERLQKSARDQLVCIGIKHPWSLVRGDWDGSPAPDRCAGPAGRPRAEGRRGVPGVTDDHAAVLGGGALRAKGSSPLYLRLQDRIRGAIETGRLKPNEALPGERDIAGALSVSRVTVRKALAGLVESGLLHQRQGSGTFVAAKPRRVEQALSRLTSFSEDMRVRGQAPTVRLIRCEISTPSPHEAMHLQLSPRDSVSRLRRLRLADGVPMAIEQAALPLSALPDPDAIGDSLYAALEARGLRPVRALQRLSAAKLEAADALLLDVEAGAAALSIERVAYLPDGRPIEFTRSLYRGDAYDFVAELTLKDEP